MALPKLLPVRAVGLPWFRKEDYSALRQIFTDRDKMYDTWEEWLASAEKSESNAKAQVHTVERVYIDPATFPAWCDANGTTVDSAGRNKFVATVIAQKYGSTH